MADTATHELIIVRRHEEEEHAHHSSAWKVAHADFMTAMMAFFLIMWLISVTDDQMRKGIAQYFNPIHMSQGSSELKGLSKADNKDQPDIKGHGEMPLPGANVNLIDLTVGHADAKPAKAVSPEAAAAALNAAAEVAAKLAETSGVRDKDPNDKGDESTADALRKIGAAAAALKPANGGNDREAFADPYAVLAKLEQQYVNTQPTSVDAITGDARAEGMPGGEVDRDPFDPSYWQMEPLPAARADQVGKPGKAAQIPAAGKPNAAAAAAKPTVASPEATAPVEAPQTAQEKTPEEAGAEDATAAAADAAKAGGEKAVTAETVARSTEIAKDIRNSVASMMAGKASPDLAVTATDEGVAISLTDDADYAMFGVGSAVPDPKTVVLVEHIAKVLAAQPGQIIIRGHTDGRPFHSADYDNWRLSAARAQMAYYTLLRGGLDQSRVVAIEGHADRALKTPADPYAAENRRIEILVKEP
jgi:chemotaxis protein MotB